MKCKSCDVLLLDDDDIELCRKCIKQGDKLSGANAEDADVYFESDLDTSIDDALEVELYTNITESDYLLME